MASQDEDGLREELVLVVPDDGVGHEVDGLEGVDAREGVQLDVGLLEGDEGEVELALDRLQVGAQFVGLEHAQPHLIQGELEVAEVVPGVNCIRIGLPGKLFLRDYFQENMISPRPFSYLEAVFREDLF